MRYLKYLRIKYKHLGRGWVKGDCLNLLLLFYKEELNIDILDYVEGYDEDWAVKGLNLFLDQRISRGFEDTALPSFGDVILFQIKGKVLHCGIVIDPAQGTFIHTTKQGTFIENYVTTVWANRLHGFCRHIKRNSHAI